MNPHLPHKRLLVTGASGFLGWNVCQIAAVNWQVYGTYWSQTIVIPDVTMLKVNLVDIEAIKELFQRVQPNAVIHLAAQSNANRCQTDPEASYQVNVTAAAAIADLCAKSDIPCAFSSTDLVFDGLQAPYRETDPVSPINHYGEQKAIAEAEMQRRYPRTAICRMPLMFGAVPPTANSFIQPLIRGMQQGADMPLFSDEFRTPVSATTAAQGLLLALEQVQGRIHLGGRDRLSRYDIGCLLADVFDLPATGLRACRQQDMPMLAPRPPDVSMDSSKAYGLGYNPRSLRQELEELKTTLMA